MHLTETISILSLVCVSAVAEPVINEFMASNQSVYPDNCDFDDYSDWIELYNPSSSSVLLTDYYLTDDLQLPLKWKIPEGASIPPYGYLMIRADGFNAGPGETHLRGYYPWGSTFTTRRYHASFKLSAGGESIGLHRLTAPATDSLLIDTGSLWKYLDTGEDPGPDWMKNSFDDSGWYSGASELGYGDGDETTEIGYGPSPSNKYPTTFFRTRFMVSDPTLLGDIRFRVKIDDGAIVYLNGEEAARIRMPEGPVDSLDLTPLGGGEYGFESVDIPASMLQAGENVLAIEVHQASASSSDLSMDAELTVSIVNPIDIVQIDAVTNFPPQLTDVSYGRDSASTNGWSFFAAPTPESANTSEALTAFVDAPETAASLDSGFYSGAQSVTLSTTAGTIRYTFDGSVPDSESPVYSSALTISETTILRARAFISGQIPGPMLTRTYFIDEETTLPVFSFVADPETLFGDTIGIADNRCTYYQNVNVIGTGYYPLKGREVPIHLEMFEADKSLAFAVNAGTRIAGENIWGRAQKPFNIYMRSKYGDDLINYQLFPGQPVASFGELYLRNGGDDWSGSLLRDALLVPMIEDRIEAESYSYQPSIVFINGEFWGIYNIRKRFDETYFANEHQLASGEYDQVKWAHDETGTTVLQADSGSIEAYESFRSFCMTNDTSDPAIYRQIEEQMDIDSFLDYIIVTDYAVNTSWSHNREFWRGTAEGSKWRWVVNDMDRGFNNATGSLIDNFRDSYTLFQRLDNNPEFVNRLLQRYAAHLGSSFYPQRLSDQLDLLSADMTGEIQRHIDRWSSEGGISSVSSWESDLNSIKQFFYNRPAYARSRLELELGINRGLADLTINNLPAAGGNVLIAGVSMIPEYNRTIPMFMNTPIELTADPAPGYSFVRWSNGETNRTIEITLSGAQALTAEYQSGAETIIPSVISSDTTLTADGSPYTVTNNLLVEADATLTLEAGVRLQMPAGKSILVNGALNANGTAENGIEFVSRSGAPWGNLSFVNTTAESSLSYVTIRDTSPSRQDPKNRFAAIAGYNATITLDHMDIEALLPIFSRYGSTTLRNSMIHILFTGDGINIKSGDGLVENCTFIGNHAPDTDAIDFDNVVDGSIAGNHIYAFFGFNSDAIDVGEGCQDLMVVSNRIFNVTDKGVSVGQASVAYIERNLIVDCDMGVGIKDTDSTAYIDQNTFARCNTGVASFEKNPGAGGGIAYISNCIFTRTKDDPIFVDSLSRLSVDYSLSDTLALPGTGNLLADPLFTDEGAYDYSLTIESPAVDSGDPAHMTDADGSRADMGAYYAYDPNDYPYYIPNLVVINEVLAHSHDIAPDWIELYNSSAQDIDLGGWYLSDDSKTPKKYRIADGTILPAHGYYVFYEDLNFGIGTSDPGALIPFALSENGDTVCILGPGNELRPDYVEKESFGATLRGVSRGRYYKASTRTYNFVAMTEPTPWEPNSAPQVGPIVISEIMYHPPVAEAEYIELANISSSAITLYDTQMAAPWKMTQGLDHLFSATVPVVMQPGEKIMLVRNAPAFTNEYSIPEGTQIIQWDAGSLDNGGETLELSRPGDTNEVGELQYVRVDRVDYSDSDPWPDGPDGYGLALVRINELAYGNDFSNWRSATATPAQTGYEKWAAEQTLPAGQDGPADDPDGDGIETILEYAIGTDPLTPSAMVGTYQLYPGAVSFILPAIRGDLDYTIQRATQLVSPDWIDLPGTVSTAGETTRIDALDSDEPSQAFYRLVITLNNQ